MCFAVFENHPAGAEARFLPLASVGTAEAVPFQDNLVSNFEMRLPWHPFWFHPR
jgi:hypothetical protein